MDATREPFFARFWILIFRSVIGFMMGMTVIACEARPSPIPEGTDTRWYGNIVSGGKFDVQIGDDYSSAKDVLVEQGFYVSTFYSEELVSCSKSSGATFECSDPQKFAQFRMKRFGKSGSVFLVVDDGQVVQIVWSFAVFQWE
ncbi:MAG: hypothetical protein AAGD92_05880 [Pseudomonadota bacterium]